MKIFMSWSGARSRAAAEFLSDWIQCVIQAAQPWISTRDLDRGALWFSEISEQLKDTAIGIVCLTQENKHRPWILFEVGALAKGLSHNRVCTFLVDLTPTDIEGPLAQFNHTLPERTDVWELVRTLNNCLGSTQLDERILENVFNTYWPQFEERLQTALEQHPQTQIPEPRSEANLLTEVLENTRILTQRMREIERRLTHKERPHYGLLGTPSVKSTANRFRNASEVEAIFAGVDPPSVTNTLRNLGLSEFDISNIARQLSKPDDDPNLSD